MSRKQKSFLENPAFWLRKTPDLIIYFAAGLLLVDKTIKSLSGFSFLDKLGSELIVTIGIAIISLVAINVTLKINTLIAEVKKLSSKYLGVLEVLGSHEYIDFPELLEKSKTVKMLTLSGTKTGQLGDTGVKEILLNPQRKSSITLLLANPYSSAIIRRYEHDEPSTYEAGPDGIKRRLLWLYKLISKLPAHAQNKIDIRVFDSYPNISIIQADHDIYSTVYGFRLRGGDCPKVHATTDGDYGIFLKKHFQKVYDDSTPLQDWMKKYQKNIQDEMISPNQ